jgi:hypothetical protein
MIVPHGSSGEMFIEADDFETLKLFSREIYSQDMPLLKELDKSLSCWCYKHLAPDGAKMQAAWWGIVRLLFC